MNRPTIALLAGTLALSACVSRSDYDGKAREAASARQEADSAKLQATHLQQQLDDQQHQVDDLKGALGMAQSQAITDEQKALLDEAKHAMDEARERGKLLGDLESKFKKMIDAGHLKVTTRHGRIVLQLHNDVLFDAGSAEVKPAGKEAVAEVAATLRSMSGRRFQVAGHTDSEPMTADTKKRFPTNWELSSARAIAVVKVLVADGVEATVLSAAGYGPFDPVAPNGTAEGQAKNRRIEITLVPHVAQALQAIAAEAPKR